MITNQKFKAFSTGELYEINGIIMEPGKVSLFDSITGVGGFGYIPTEGSDVTVVVPIDTSSNVLNFSIGLNNTVYYLLTNQIYTEADYDTIISIATPISVAYNDKDAYEGSFKFENPNGYSNLYLIWDYTDNLYTGTGFYIGEDAEKQILINFEDTLGYSGIKITKYASNTNRFILKWNGSQVYDTGEITTTGDIYMYFKKYLPATDAVLTMQTIDGTTDVEFEVLPVLTRPFGLDPDPWDTKELACDSVITTTEYYNDSYDGIVSVGTRIYTTATGVIFEGNNKYYIIDDGTQSYALIDNNGVVLDIGLCGCTETSAPVISVYNPTDLILNNPINIKLETENNPTSFTLISDYKIYEITGGTNGSIWAVDLSNGTNKNITVGINQKITVSSNDAISYPTLIFGDGISTEIGVDQSMVLPKGINIDLKAGTISGTPVVTGDWEISLTASNCVGTSDPVSFRIVVDSGIILTPFAIDVENFSDTNVGACAVSPIYTIMYHDGTDNDPKVKDKVYIDYRARDPFMGGKRWYRIDNGSTAILIDETGEVLDSYACAAP